MSWSEAELNAIGASVELEITTYRKDETPRRFLPIWAVTVDGDVYVRTWHRRDTGWFGHAVQSGRARVRVPGVEADVTVEDVGAERRDAVDAAYREKYASHGDSSVGGMITEDAVAATLRLIRDTNPLPSG